MPSVPADFRRYAQLIASALPDSLPFHAEAESDAAVQVERGTIYPVMLRHPTDLIGADRVERLIELSVSPRLASLSVVDRLGHQRRAYRGLLIYAWLQAYRLAYETLPRGEFGRWEEALRRWCDLLEAELGGIEWPVGAIPAGRGDSIGEAAWTALALYVAGKVFIRDAWTDLAADTFGRLVRAQQAGGAFLDAGPRDNPETLWYHELVLLHAAASYAVQTEDRTIAAAVARATRFHQETTQPDHASGQPWALFAFVWNADTRPLADGLLHTAATQHPEGRDGITTMLLADALYCLRLFDTPPSAPGRSRGSAR